MVDATRALLDELMGAERNAPLSHRGAEGGGEGSEPPSSRRRLPRFDDLEVCKFELAGLCPHGLFTNTRSDLGPCRWKVHSDALAWESLQKQYDEEVTPEERKDRRSRRSYGFALRDELAVLVRDLDRRIERARREREALDAARGGNNNANVGGATGAAGAGAGATAPAQLQQAPAPPPPPASTSSLPPLLPTPLLPEDLALVANLRARSSAATAAADEAAAEGDVDRAMTLAAEGESLNAAADAAQACGVTRAYTAQAAARAAEAVAAKAAAEAAASAATTTAKAAAPTNELAPLPPAPVPIRPPVTAQQQLRPCEVSGILLAVNETEARLKEHYAGKQFQGWKAIRETLARLVAELGPAPTSGSSSHHHSHHHSYPSNPSGSGPPPPLSRGRGGSRERERERDSSYYRGRRDNGDDGDRRSSRRRSRSRSRSRERSRERERERRRRSRSRSRERGDRGYYRRDDRDNRDDRGRSRRRSRSYEPGEAWGSGGGGGQRR